MSYTDYEYLNKMIAIAVEDGIVTEDEIRSVVYRRGNGHDYIAIDILSIVYERRKDRKMLEKMQAIYRQRKD